MRINLKNKRVERGYTQKELAQKCGVGYTTYQEIELGISSPNSSTLIKILKVLGYRSTAKTIDHLLEQED